MFTFRSLSVFIRDMERTTPCHIYTQALYLPPLDHRLASANVVISWFVLSEGL